MTSTIPVHLVGRHTDLAMQGLVRAHSHALLDPAFSASSLKLGLDSPLLRKHLPDDEEFMIKHKPLWRRAFRSNSCCFCTSNSLSAKAEKRRMEREELLVRAQEFISARPDRRVLVEALGSVVLEFVPSASDDTFARVLCVSGGSTDEDVCHDLAEFACERKQHEPFLAILLVDCHGAAFEQVVQLCRRAGVDESRVMFSHLNSSSTPEKALGDLVDVLRYVALLNALFSEGFID